MENMIVRTNNWITGSIFRQLRMKFSTLLEDGHGFDVIPSNNGCFNTKNGLFHDWIIWGSPMNVGVIAVNQKVTLINAPCVSNPQVAQTAILWPCGLQEQKMPALLLATVSHPKLYR